MRKEIVLKFTSLFVSVFFMVNTVCMALPVKSPRSSRLNSLLDTTCGEVSSKVTAQVFGNVWKGDIANSKSWAAVLYLLKDDPKVKPEVREKARALFDIAFKYADVINDSDDRVSMVQKLLESDDVFFKAVDDAMSIDVKARAKWSKWSFERRVLYHIEKTEEKELTIITRTLKGAKDAFIKNKNIWGYVDWNDFMIKHGLLKEDEIKRSWTPELFDSQVLPFLEKGIYKLDQMGKVFNTAFYRNRKEWEYVSWYDYLEKKGYGTRDMLKPEWTYEYCLLRLRWNIEVYGVEKNKHIHFFDPTLSGHIYDNLRDWGLLSWADAVRKAKLVSLDESYKYFCKKHEQSLKIKGVDPEKQLLEYEIFLEKKENEIKEARENRMPKRKKYDLADPKDALNYAKAVNAAQRYCSEAAASLVQAKTDDQFISDVVKEMLRVPKSDESARLKFDSIVKNTYLTQAEASSLLNMEYLLKREIELVAKAFDVDRMIRRVQSEISLMRDRGFADSDIRNSLKHGFSYSDLMRMARNNFQNKKAVDVARINWTRKSAEYRRKYSSLSFPVLDCVLEVKKAPSGLAYCSKGYEGVQLKMGVHNPLSEDLRKGNLRLLCEDRKVKVINTRTSEEWVFTINLRNQLCYEGKVIKAVVFRESNKTSVVTLTDYMFSDYEISLYKISRRLTRNARDRGYKRFFTETKSILTDIEKLCSDNKTLYKVFMDISKMVDVRSLNSLVLSRPSAEEFRSTLALFFTERRKKLSAFFRLKLWLYRDDLRSIIKEKDKESLDLFIKDKMQPYGKKYGRALIYDLLERERKRYAKYDMWKTLGVFFNNYDADQLDYDLRANYDQSKNIQYKEGEDNQTAFFVWHNFLLCFPHESLLRDHISAGDIFVHTIGDLIVIENKRFKVRQFLYYNAESDCICDLEGNELLRRKGESRRSYFNMDRYLKIHSIKTVLTDRIEEWKEKTRPKGAPELLRFIDDLWNIYMSNVDFEGYKSIANVLDHSVLRHITESSFDLMDVSLYLSNETIPAEKKVEYILYYLGKQLPKIDNEHLQEKIKYLLSEYISVYGNVAGFNTESCYGFARSFVRFFNGKELKKILGEEHDINLMHDFITKYYSEKRETFRRELSKIAKTCRASLYSRIHTKDESFQFAVRLYFSNIVKTSGFEIFTELFPTKDGTLSSSFHYLYDVYLSEQEEKKVWEAEKRLFDILFADEFSDDEPAKKEMEEDVPISLMDSLCQRIAEHLRKIIRTEDFASEAERARLKSVLKQVFVLWNAYMENDEKLNIENEAKVAGIRFPFNSDSDFVEERAKALLRFVIKAGGKDGAFSSSEEGMILNALDKWMEGDFEAFWNMITPVLALIKSDIESMNSIFVFERKENLACSVIDGDVDTSDRKRFDALYALMQAAEKKGLVLNVFISKSVRESIVFPVVSGTLNQLSSIGVRVKRCETEEDSMIRIGTVSDSFESGGNTFTFSGKQDSLSAEIRLFRSFFDRMLSRSIDKDGQMNINMEEMHDFLEFNKDRNSFRIKKEVIDAVLKIDHESVFAVAA